MIRLHICVIAQVAHVGGTFARQNHQCISDILAAIVEVRCIVDPVAQVIHGMAEGDIRHRVALGPRAGQEVADIAVQPEIPRVRIPEAKGAVGRLTGQNHSNGLIDAFLYLVALAQPEG